MSLALGILFLLLLVAALTLWFFLKPRLSGGADLSLLQTNYAHRGLWDARLPQASTEAIALAARLGYGTKIEVRMTRTHTLMAMGAVPIPLTHVLSVLNGKAPLMIEIGEKKTNLRLCLLLAKLLDNYEGTFSVVSKDPKMLAWFKNYRPSFARGQIVSPQSDFATLYLLRNRLARPDFLVVEKTARANPSVLLLTKLFRVPCFVTLIDTPKEYHACQRRGDLVIFKNIRPKEPPKKGKQHEQFYL